HVIIRLLNRVNDDTAVQDGGSDADVITVERADLEVSPPVALTEPSATSAQAIVPAQKARDVTPAQLELSLRTGANGYQVVSLAGATLAVWPGPPLAIWPGPRAGPDRSVHCDHGGCQPLALSLELLPALNLTARASGGTPMAEEVQGQAAEESESAESSEATIA